MSYFCRVSKLSEDIYIAIFLMLYPCRSWVHVSAAFPRSFWSKLAERRRMPRREIPNGCPQMTCWSNLETEDLLCETISDVNVFLICQRHAKHISCIQENIDIDPENMYIYIYMYIYICIHIYIYVLEESSNRLFGDVCVSWTLQVSLALRVCRMDKDNKDANCLANAKLV